MRKQLAKGAAWISAARMSVNLLGFISTLVLARLLMPADFGLVALCTTILAILSSTTNLSLSSALVQQKSLTDQYFDTAWTLNFARGLAIALVVAALAYPISLIYSDKRLVSIMLVLAASMIIDGLGNPKMVLFVREMIFWQQFLMQFAQKFSVFIVSVSIAIIYKTYWSLVIGTIAGQIVSLIISYVVMPYRPRVSFEKARELFSFSGWITLGQILNTINWRFDQLAIGGFLGKAALGHYTVGDNLAQMGTREATAPLTGALFPAFAKLSGDPPRLASAYQSVQALVTAIALPIGFGVALVADPLIRLLMGDKWAASILVVQVLAAVFALTTLGGLAQPLAMATGATRLLFVRDLQGFALRLPIIIGAMYLWGLPGIIYARAATGTIGITFGMNVVKKVTGLQVIKQLSVNVRSLCSVALMSAAVWGGSGLHYGVGQIGLIFDVAVRVAIGVIAYPLAHLSLWLLAGRPSGPETEILKAFSGLIGRARRRS